MFPYQKPSSVLGGTPGRPWVSPMGFYPLKGYGSCEWMKIMLTQFDDMVRSAERFSTVLTRQYLDPNSWLVYVGL